MGHGVKEGLVERSAEWPGLTCLAQPLGPARRLFQWFNGTTLTWLLCERGPSARSLSATCRKRPSPPC